MLSRRSIVAGLVGVNLFLLGVLLFSTFPPAAAYAQATGRPGDFMAVSCQVHQNFDALYILDGPARLLHCFVPAQNSTGKLVYAQTRSLANDFRR